MNVIGHHYRAVQREARSAWRLPRHTRSERSCGLPRAGPSGGAYRTLRKCLYCRSDSAEGDGGIRRFASCRTRIAQRCCTGEDARAYIVADCFKMGLAKTMMRRNRRERPMPSLDVAASSSPKPVQSRCRRERLAPTHPISHVGASVSLVPSSTVTGSFKMKLGKAMIMRKIDVAAGVSPQPIQSRCSRRRLAPIHPVSM